jgi:RND family efflux transporter MFP subunit
MNIVRDDALRVSIAVPEAEAPYVDLGDEVSIDFPAIKGGAISGKVSRTAGVIDTAHRSLTTIVDIPNSEHRFRPGLYATATIVLHEQPSALTLPSAAVVRTPQEAYCFRFVQGKAVKTLVQVGLKIADEFEITSGIAETDLVILNKAIQLKDDQSVASQPK